MSVGDFDAAGLKAIRRDHDRLVCTNVARFSHKSVDPFHRYLARIVFAFDNGQVVVKSVLEPDRHVELPPLNNIVPPYFRALGFGMMNRRYEAFESLPVGSCHGEMLFGANE